MKFKLESVDQLGSRAGILKEAGKKIEPPKSNLSFAHKADVGINYLNT